MRLSAWLAASASSFAPLAGGNGSGGDGCPQDWLDERDLGPLACNVVTFAYVRTTSPDLQEQQWQHGLELYANHTNSLGGMHLGKAGELRRVGYISASSELADPTQEGNAAGFINGYRRLCDNPDATVLVTPFAAGAQVVDTVINTIRQSCPHKTIMAAGGDDRPVDFDPKDSKVAWSIYSRPARWAAAPLQYLYDQGARTFAIAGPKDDSSSMAMKAILQGVVDWIATVADAELVGDSKVVSFVAEAVKADPDVFIGAGRDEFFEAILETFNTLCYTPRAAIFIESDGDGPAVGPFRVQGSKWHTDGRKWLATVPWLTSMPHLGPQAWPANLPDPYNLTLENAGKRFNKKGAERYMGSADTFAAKATEYLGQPPTYYHAAGAATMMTFQLAVELAPNAQGGWGLTYDQVSRNTSDTVQSVTQALRALDIETFWGAINLTESGDNSLFEMGLARVLDYDRASPSQLELLAVGSNVLLRDKVYPISPADYGLEGGNDIGSRCNMHWFWWTMLAVAAALCIGLVVGGLWFRNKRPKRQSVSSLMRKSLLGGSGELPEAVLATLDVPSRWMQAEWESDIAAQGQLQASNAIKRTGHRHTAPDMVRRQNSSANLEITRRLRKTASPVGGLKVMFSNEHVRQLKPRDWRTQVLGSGTYGTVYRANWRNQDIAIKVLTLPEEPPSAQVDGPAREALKRKVRAARDDFLKEVEVCCDLRHRNLVTLLGYATTPTLIIAQEVMDGGALDKQLYVEGWRPTHAQVVQMALEVASGLVYLHTAFQSDNQHDKPVIHRDLKSPNLLLTAPPPPPNAPPNSSLFTVKVADFGLSRDKNITAAGETERMTGCGSVLWMAPEILNGEQYNEKVDVYSYAMCLIEMVDCSLPWSKCQCRAQQIPLKISRGERPEEQLVRSSAEEELRQLIRMCWAQKPAERPSFEEIVARVHDISSAMPEETSYDHTYDHT